MAARMLLKLHLKGHGVVPGAVSRLTHCTDPPCSYFILYLELCVRTLFKIHLSQQREIRRISDGSTGVFVFRKDG